MFLFFFFQAEDGIRDKLVTGVQTCALPISWGFSSEAAESEAQDEKPHVLDTRVRQESLEVGLADHEGRRYGDREQAEGHEQRLGERTQSRGRSDFGDAR